jgi:hypothetical protein
MIKRGQQLQYYKDTITCCKVDNERLYRKKKTLDLLLRKYNQVTITGTILEIEKEFKNIKKDKLNLIKQRNNLIKDIFVNEQNERASLNVINRLNQLTEMEDDVKYYHNVINIKPLIEKNEKNNKNKKNNINDPLLKAIYKLPNELIKYIQEFFTYETKCELLESKYQPYKIINKFPGLKIRNIIKLVFEKQIMKINNDVDWKKQMIHSYKIFYDTKIINNVYKIKRNLPDEKTFLIYTLITFRYTCPEILYELFKIIIITSNKKKLKIKN